MDRSWGPVRPAVSLCALLALVAALLLVGSPRAEARRAAEGTVSGRVTDAAGAPVAGIRVRVYEPGHTSADSPWDAARGTRTASDGTWSVRFSEWGLSGSYKISADAEDDAHLVTWYQRSPTPEGGTSVPFTAGVDRAGVDIVLLDVPPPGQVTGTLRGNGARLSAVRVAAFAADQTQNEWPASETRSDSQGRFTLADLQPGSYRIMADGSDYGLPVRYWPASTTFAGATLVTVPAGGTAAGIDFNLTVSQVFPPKPGGRIAVPRAPSGLTGTPVDALQGYQGQVKCRRSARPGTKALLRLIFASYGATEGAGLNRTCVTGTSEHYDGRAIDWMVHSRIPQQAAKGDAFARWLTRAQGREVGAMARRLGVMYVIWRGRIWKQYEASQGWQTYLNCDRPKTFKPELDSTCHRNHVHISLTHGGAAMRTSWWRAASA